MDKKAEGERQSEGVSTPKDNKREGIGEEMDVEQAERLVVELERFVDAGIISGETYDNIRRMVEKKLGVGYEPVRSEYEIKNDFVSREKLIKHVPKLLGDLSDVDFHSWYHLLWTLSTHRMLQRMRQEDKERGE